MGTFLDPGSAKKVVVAVGSEQYRVRIDDEVLATKARRRMLGAERHQIVTGEVARRAISKAASAIG